MTDRGMFYRVYNKRTGKYMSNDIKSDCWTLRNKNSAVSLLTRRLQMNYKWYELVLMEFRVDKPPKQYYYLDEVLTSEDGIDTEFIDLLFFGDKGG